MVTSGEIIAAILTGVAGLVTIFFGRSFWNIFKDLIDDNQTEIVRLRQRLDDLQKKLDTMEKQLTEALLEQSRLVAKLDEYAGQAQNLLFENSRLKTLVSDLQEELAQCLSERNGASNEQIG